MNKVDGLLTAKDRQIADLINQAHAARRPRKRRPHHHSEGIDNSQAPNPPTVEERTRAAGRRFALLKSLFFVDDERVWAVQKDEMFTRTKEFDSDEGRVQGQLLDVLNVLPENVHQWRQYEWLSLATTAHFDDEEPPSCFTHGQPFDTSPPLVPTPFTIIVPLSSYWSNIGFNLT
ncbi:hypothetical protein B0H14DRAFT_3875350 [Mycena olivaceomarginata]|nr:hypothetical protein B0H14DRAFT_3875350 [Mycena olivaceomarginata]